MPRSRAGVRGAAAATVAASGGHWSRSSPPPATPTSKALQRVVDVQGGYGDVIRFLEMPTSHVILDRAVWGRSALLGRLHASDQWPGRLAEYRKGGPPVTELGRIEEAWRGSRAVAP